jgi:hypothetical protein
MIFSMHRLLPLLLALACNTALWADATLFVQEPYGLFGAINPTRHASVYRSRVCAETPVVLRRCDPGEFGIVISRYRKVSGHDWIAIPLIPYLYAVEDLTSIPAEANADAVSYLRDEYRRKHLLDVVPDRPGGQLPDGIMDRISRRCLQSQNLRLSDRDHGSAGSVSDLRTQLAEEQKPLDLFFNNCADFSRGILNLYYAGAIRRNYIADAGITTPQQIAKSLISYAKNHPGFPLSAFFLPQIPGSRHLSHKVDGVSASLVKSKKYILPLAAFHPWVACSIVAIYLANGRFNVAHYAETEYSPVDLSMLQDSSVPRRDELAQRK